MKTEQAANLTVLDCLLLDGSKALVSFVDCGIRERSLKGRRFKVYTSRIKLVPVTSDASRRCKTRYSRVPVDIAEASGNPQGFRLSCDKAAMEGLGIDVESVFAELGR